MSENIERIVQLNEYKLPTWDDLPELDLYMDQVVELIDGYLQPLFVYDEKIITATMINNYVKLKLITRPEKKKYNKNHIASIIAITVLKQVFPISEISVGIQQQTTLYGAQRAYDNFCTYQQTALQTLCANLLQHTEVIQIGAHENMNNMYVKMATLSFASKIITEQIMRNNVSEEEESRRKKDDKK